VTYDTRDFTQASFAASPTSGSLTGGTNGTPPGTPNYFYDAEGRRIRKATAGGTVDYVYDLAGHVVSEVSSAGGWNRGEVYAGGRHLATYMGGTGGSTYFTFADWLGNERVRTTTNGSIYSTWTNLPFGEGSASPNPGTTHFTGKERDSESNLDNFEKRYYGSDLGRLMSPDPVFFQAEMLTDPQRFNEYAYARNTPLLFIDPSGEAIRLSSDATEQQEQLNAICSAAGINSDKCSYYIYANQASDGNYYVGTYTNDADGQGSSFQDLNSVSGAIAGIINDPRVVQLDVVSAGTQIKDEQGRKATIGPLNRRAGTVPGATYTRTDGTLHVVFLDPATSPGSLNASVMSNHKPGFIDPGIIVAHELGNVQYLWGSGFWHFFDDADSSAIRLENKARMLRDPSAPRRTAHDPPDWDKD
jgi:RHS repeat-associated protein